MFNEQKYFNYYQVSSLISVTCPFCCLGDWWNTWHTEGHRGIPWNR